MESHVLARFKKIIFQTDFTWEKNGNERFLFIIFRLECARQNSAKPFRVPFGGPGGAQKRSRFLLQTLYNHPPAYSSTFKIL